jgi:hypothetical protein
MGKGDGTIYEVREALWPWAVPGCISLFVGNGDTTVIDANPARRVSLHSAAGRLDRADAEYAQALEPGARAS